MAGKSTGFGKSRGLGVGAKSWSTSVGKATRVWRNPRKPRMGRSKKGW